MGCACNMGQGRRLLLILVYTSVWCVSTRAYKNGAGHAACETLDPGANHGAQGPDPVPYEMVILGATSYTDEQSVNVLVRGTKTFNGLMVQARRAGSGADWRPVGAFAVPNDSTGMRLMTCLSWGDTVTQKASFNELNNIVFTWIAPQGNNGDIEFVANVNQDVNWWYNNVKSATIPYVVPPTPTSTTTTTTTTVVPGGTTTTTASGGGTTISSHAGYHLVLAMTLALVACIFGQ